MASDPFGIVKTLIAGTYEVEAPVAEGGFAVVYRAHHTGFHAPVALKCLKLSRKLTEDRQARFLAQFKAEAALLFQLSAGIPTVVRPLHIDALTTATGTFVPYMVLEWLEGETLATIIEQREADGRPPPPLKKLVRLLAPVARALERAHNFSTADGTAVRIVHCDIKPENIFVARVAGEQLVKILDFGVAKAQLVASEVAGDKAKPGAAQSLTPAYAAPEQWAPDKLGEVGPWTDVWGLALTLVEAMAGRPVIERDVGAMMGIALDPIARPTPRNNDVDVSDAVEDVFERALALNPTDRQPDVGVFWEQLQVAIGMRDERIRDARREAGAMLREERVEMARPKVEVRRIAKLRLAAGPGAAPKEKPKRKQLTVDDPFEQDDPPAAAAPAGEAMPVIPALVPEPAARQRPQIAEATASPGPAAVAAALPSLEANIPSLPPGQSLDTGGLEATFPSGPPAAPTRQNPIPTFELEAPLQSSPRASRPDDPLEASLRPAEQYRAPPGGPREIELATGPIQVELGTDLVRPAPRGGVARPVVPAGVAVKPERRQVGLWVVGLALIVVAMVIGVADRALRGEDGTPLFTLGPVSLSLVAGILLLAGVGVIIYRLLPKDRE